MRITSAAKVIAAMGVGTSPAAEKNVEQSLDLALSVIENVLDTVVAPHRGTDFFHLPPSTDTLYLSRGFASAKSLVIRQSRTQEESADITAGDTVPSTEYTVMEEKGLVVFSLPFTTRTFLSVTYSSGLPVSDEDEELYAAPQWVEQAAIALTIRAVQAQTTHPASRKEKASYTVGNDLRALAYTLLSSHYRPRMVPTPPLRSTARVSVT